MFAKDILAATTAVSLVLGWGGVAQAQEASTADVGEVVVTGSRIQGNTETPTPVTATTYEEMKATAPNLVAEALNQLPAFKGSPTSRGNRGSANNPAGGGNTLSLRGLGPNRTLVLLDGRRFTPTNAAGTIDANVFPQSLIQRVEVVTGGASAAYGSDAVSGVVNFILDTSFEGLKGEVSTSLASRGDFPAYKVGLAFGSGFADDRGRIIASLDYFKLENPGLDWQQDPNRPWTKEIGNWVNNPVAGQRPLRLRCSDARWSSTSQGGLITAGVLRGTEFDANGQPRAHDYGTLAGPVLQCGGASGRDLSLSGMGASYNPQVNGFAHVEYELEGGHTIFAEANLTHERLETTQYHVWHFGSNNVTIQADNAFLPESLRQRLAAAGATSFPMGTIAADDEPLTINTDVDLTRFLAGIRGEFAGFRYNAYASHGQTRYKVNNKNNVIDANYYAAIDSVRDPRTGNIVCRATLQGFFPGCVPFNPFGANSASDAANRYVRGNSVRDLHYTQDVFAADFQRALFSLGDAQPVSVAFGGEFRLEKATLATDPISSSSVAVPGVRGVPATLIGKAGGFTVGNPFPYSGKYDVREGFVEIVAPILADAPLAKDLTLNAAGRITDYSTSGTVETWKVGGSYRPIEDIHLRITRSRDIRAPSIAELYSAGVGNAGSQRAHPVTGAVLFTQGPLQGGNPNLTPEVADTFTVGGSYSPSWAPGFDITIDYYKIKIRDALGFPNEDQILRDCLISSSPVACAYFDRITPDLVVRTQRFVNLAEVERRGFDIEVGYRNGDVFGGEFTARLLASKLDKATSQNPGQVATSTAGSIIEPHWSGTLRLSYKREKVGVFLSTNYLSGGKYNPSWVEGVDIDDNTVPPLAYTDLTLTYDFGLADGKHQAFLTIQNVLDLDPPWAPLQAATDIQTSNYDVYDPIGRYFTAGVRFTF